MPFPKQCVEQLLLRPGRFFQQVISSFRRNQGLLLSGAVAYYMLLSIVPLLALLLIGLSHFLDERDLLATISSHLDLIVPARTGVLSTQIETFLRHREVVGWVGILVLVFFSTLAFTVLENAMTVIFFHRVRVHRRHFMVSALIPFLFIFFLGLGILLVTVISAALQTVDTHHIPIFGRVWDLSGAAGVTLYSMGVVGLMLMLTALYLVMPVGRIALPHALIGGVIAGLLWEIARHILVWYFSTLSFVNVVYGSLASAVVALLSFEAAALILLFCAQVIAEFERCALETDPDGWQEFHT